MRTAFSLGGLPRTIIALALLSLLTDVSSEMIYPLVPLFVTTTLGASVAFVGLIEGGAQAVNAFLQVLSGGWSDRMARRKPLVVAGYGLSSLVRPLVTLANTAGVVLGIRVLDRVGKGIRSAPRDAMIASAVDAKSRGRAFGFHRAADHLGAVLGSIIAWLLLELGGASVRQVFLYAAIPAALAMVVLIGGVKESSAPPVVHDAAATPSAVVRDGTRMPRPFMKYVGILLLFTIGNSTDAFLLLRVGELGVSVARLPLIWAALHVTKVLTSTWGGALSDRLGRRPLIVTGWCVYAAVYCGFAFASRELHAWLLMLAYGVFSGLSEGAEKAFVADLVGPAVRGRAFGWYNLALGLGALPASVLFGLVWARYGAHAAFLLGAGIALAASAMLLRLRVIPSPAVIELR